VRELTPDLSQRIERFDAKIRNIAQIHPVCKKLQKIDGIGPVAATALVAAIGDGTQFKNGRQCAAWLIFPMLLFLDSRGGPYIG